MYFSDQTEVNISLTHQGYVYFSDPGVRGGYIFLTSLGRVYFSDLSGEGAFI